MRLIDADALIEKLRRDPVGKMLIENYNLDNFINGRPTIEPEQKRGKWIETLEFHGIYDEVVIFPGRAYACSVCKVAFPTRDYTVEDFRYCPNCGARMGEE